MKRTTRSKRPRHAMPASVRNALRGAGLWDAYEERPPYQRNDYIGWITRAKRPATREKRLAQMLAELAAGNIYMNMPHRTKRRPV